MHYLLSTIFLNSAETQELWLRVMITCILTFIINLPFGYWRGNFRKLSFWWFAAIHIPVPLIILIRKLYHLHLTWSLLPFLLGSFFLGQFAGRKIYAIRNTKKPE